MRTHTHTASTGNLLVWSGWRFSKNNNNDTGLYTPSCVSLTVSHVSITAPCHTPHNPILHITLLANVCTSPRYHNKTTQSNVDPKAPIYIVTGAAGCNELHEPFTKQQPPRSAFRSNTFGYAGRRRVTSYHSVQCERNMHTLRHEHFHHTET